MAFLNKDSVHIPIGTVSKDVTVIEKYFRIDDTIEILYFPI